MNRHEFPNGGWAFRQPQTNWVNPANMIGFKASVDAIRKHRAANPAVALKYGLSTDPEKISEELEAYTRRRLGMPDPAPSFFQRGSNRLQNRVVEVAADIKTAAKGTALVLDWLGAGADPAPQELAEKRAATCVDCPNNVQGAWFTEAPAELIKEAVKAWQVLRGKSFPFETRQADNLKSCDVCKCLMRLKVFVGMDHIVKKTPADIMARFPSNCWIKRLDR